QVRRMNKAGKAVAPTVEACSAAAANANWEGTPGFGVILTNEAGAASWPIAGATFILIHKQPGDPAAAGAALKFFNWAYAKGGQMAQELDYVPMPPSVVSAVQRLWAAEIKDASGKPLFVLPTYLPLRSSPRSSAAQNKGAAALLPRRRERRQNTFAAGG